MRTGKIAGMIVILFLGFLSVFIGGKPGLLAGLLLLFFVSFGFLYYGMIPRKLPCALRFPSTAEKGKVLHGKFVINQPGRLPLFYGKAFGTVENQLTGEKTEFSIGISLMGKEEGTAPIDICSDYMGCLKISIERITLSGLFGIGEKNLEITLKKEIWILPDTREITLSLTLPRGRAGDGEDVVASLRGFDSSLYQGVRPYREGDSMRQIHWKMTGKTEEYMVKELGEPALFMPMVLLDTTVEKKEPSCLDSLMEEYISISQWLTEQKVSHMLCWKDGVTGDWHRHYVAELRQLDACFASLLCTGFREGNKSTLPEALEKWEQEPWWLCVMSNADDKKEMEQWSYEERTIQFINIYQG